MLQVQLRSKVGDICTNPYSFICWRLSLDHCLRRVLPLQMSLCLMRKVLYAIVSTLAYQLLLQPLSIPQPSFIVFPNRQTPQESSSVQPVLSLSLALIHHTSSMAQSPNGKAQLTRIRQWNPGPPLVTVVFSDWRDDEHGDWTCDADDAGPEEGGLFVRGPAEVFYGLGPEIGF